VASWIALSISSKVPSSRTVTSTVTSFPDLLITFAMTYPSSSYFTEGYKILLERTSRRGRTLFATNLDQNTITQLRESLQTGTPLGNDRFRAQIEQALGRAVGFSRRGRPRKPIEADSSVSGRAAKQLPLTGVGGND
jgi:hypothetical protein